MLLQEIMTRNVETVHPNDSVQDAARKMDQLNVGPLPVCEAGRVVGILTDRDIVTRAAAAGRDPRSTPVSEVMTRDVVTCTEHTDVREAAQLMEKHQIRRLLVLNAGQQLVGIVSLGDLAVKAENDPVTGEALQQISEPAKPDR